MLTLPVRELQVPIEVRAAGGLAVARVSPIGAACARCAGTGLLSVVVEGVPRVGRCRCRRPYDAAAAWNAARVPAAFADAQLPADTTALPLLRLATPAAQAVNDASRWVRSVPAGEATTGILLYGAPGVGKTWLAVALLRWLIFDRPGVPQPARFIDIDRFITDYKAGFDRSGEDRVKTDTDLDALGRRPILVLDDLNGGGSEFDRRIADDLISRRVAHGGITIATSNCEPRALDHSFSDRLGSRLAQLCEPVLMRGPDRRRAHQPRPKVAALS